MGKLARTSIKKTSPKLPPAPMKLKRIGKSVSSVFSIAKPKMSQEYMKSGEFEKKLREHSGAIMSQGGGARAKVLDVPAAMEYFSDVLEYIARITVSHAANRSPRAPKAHRKSRDKYAPVRAAIRKLSPVERQVIELYYFDSFPTDEIAEKVGISRMSVIRTVQQGTSKIRSFLGDETIARLRGTGPNVQFAD